MDIRPPDEKKPAEAAPAAQKALDAKTAEQPAAPVKTSEEIAAAELLAARQEEERKAAAQKALDKQYLDAAKKGNLKELQDLLGKGAALLANDDGNTALFYAAQYGRKDTVTFLLDAGIPLNVKNRIGSTPLTGAAGGGHKEVAWLLYTAGADPKEPNLTGMSPLGYARSAGYTDMIELLLRPREVVEVSFSRQTGDRTLQEIFNFTHQERLTLIRKGGEAGPVEAMQREGFDKISDQWQLREAFKAYKRQGGSITEAAIFPRPPETVDAPKPQAKRKWWKL